MTPEAVQAQEAAAEVAPPVVAWSRWQKEVQVVAQEPQEPLAALEVEALEAAQAVVQPEGRRQC